jgi:hypothetical protein
VALTVRLSAKEIAAIKDGTLPESLVDKVSDAELRQKAKVSGKGLAPQVAVEIFKGVLGKRLVPPLAGEYGQLAGLLKSKGLNAEQCKAAAAAAGREWKGTVRALSIVRQADKLLSVGWNSTSEPMGGWQGAVGIDE